MPKVLILNGHGGWDSNDAVFSVPDGLKIYFFCKHGEPAFDMTAINSVIKEYNKADKRDQIVAALKTACLIKETLPDSSKLCFNYGLSAPRGLTTFNSNIVKQVKTRTLLKDLAERYASEGITDIIFYACRAIGKYVDPTFHGMSPSQFHALQTGVNNMPVHYEMIVYAAKLIEDEFMNT